MAAYNPRANRLTKYDILEATGFFASNKANISSMDKDGVSLYEGPVEYPKMLYHPKGEEREIESSRIEPSPIGPQVIPAKNELIYQIVKSREEEEELRSAGWWDHPADAIEAWNAEHPAEKARVVPPKSADTRVKQLEAELERLRKLVPQGKTSTKSSEASTGL